MKMKKKAIFISSVGIIILLIGAFSFYFFKLPPVYKPSLVQGSVAQGFTANDQYVVVIAIGNKGTEDIKITDVYVNHHEQPTKAKIQVSNPKKGFVITDTFNKKARSKYIIKNINSVALQPHTSPDEQLKKWNNGGLGKNATSYGLSVINGKPIHKVVIHYRQFGRSFEKSVRISDYEY